MESERRKVYVISIHALLAESDGKDSIRNGVLCQFLSTLSLRRATRYPSSRKPYKAGFLSTLSLRRATAGCGKCTSCQSDFYPRSPCGERPPIRDIIQWEGIFLSTLSLRRATTAYSFLAARIEFLSTLSLRRATKVKGTFLMNLRISIHALLAESDEIPARSSRIVRISIHALLAESDPLLPRRHMRLTYFYPRSPCGERHDTSSLLQCQVKFLSTLSLRRATRYGRPVDVQLVFLSTLSLRRATIQWEGMKSLSEVISIHALLAESDLMR